MSSTNNTVYMHGKLHDIVCHKPGNINSFGILHKDNIFDFSVPVLMVQITLIFIITRIIYFLLRPLKQPKFVCNLLGGIILGPSVLGRNKAFRKTVLPPAETLVMNTFAQIGVMYLIFLLSVKMDLPLMLRYGRKVLAISVLSLLFPFAAIISAIILLQNYLEGLSKTFLILLTACVSIPAFPVIAYALDELDLLTSELGQIALSSAITNDVLGYCFMILAVMLFQSSSLHALWSFLSLVVVITFTVFVIRPAVFWVIKRTPEGKPVAEVYIITILLLTLIIGFITNSIGASVIDGPLILGLVIPNGPPLGATLVERADLMVSEFFMPLFFVVVGVDADVFTILNWKKFGALVCLMFVGYVGKLVGTFLSSLYCKLSFQHAFSLSLIMNIRGAVDIIMFEHWKSRKAVDDQTFVTMVLATIAVTAIVTPLVETLYDPPRRLQISSKNFYHERSIQNIRADSEFRILPCIHNEGSVHTMITLLEASNATKESPICAYTLHLVELVGQFAALLLPHDKYKSNSKFTSSDSIVGAFKNYASQTIGRVSIQPFTMIAPYKSMHEGICRLARDKLIPLIIIPFSMNQEMEGGQGNTLRSLNIKLLANAPCTVGVLVDRGLPSNMGQTKFSYHVGVLFSGGPDDRESLAYGTRMSRHGGLRITLMRFILSDEEDNDNDRERQLDDALVNEFRLTNINNNRSVYHEVLVRDVAQAMGVIGSLEDNYDLVMVGRQWGTNTLLNEEMMDWTGSAELGVVGGVLASSDFGGSMVSVLVVKQFDEAAVDNIRKSSKSLSSGGSSNFRPQMSNY